MRNAIFGFPLVALAIPLSASHPRIAGDPGRWQPPIDIPWGG